MCGSSTNTKERHHMPATKTKKTPNRKSVVPKNSYWAGRGKYETLKKQLDQKLIPRSGPCLTAGGELLRNMTKLYYDLYNNGMCNLDVLWHRWRYVLEWNDHLSKHITAGVFSKVAEALKSHKSRLQRGQDSYVSDTNFPYKEFERFTDGVIQTAKDLDAALSNAWPGVVPPGEEKGA
jgi:hypothetical protein